VSSECGRPGSDCSRCLAFEPAVQFEPDSRTLAAQVRTRNSGIEHGCTFRA
jgi:hypothetical protein